MIQTLTNETLEDAILQFRIVVVHSRRKQSSNSLRLDAILEIIRKLPRKTIYHV